MSILPSFFLPLPHTNTASLVLAQLKMKVSALLAGLTIFPSRQAAPRFPGLGPSSSHPVRTKNMLISPPGHPSLPQLDEVVTSSVNASNIQAEALIGMKQFSQAYGFFTIADPTTFKQRIGTILSTITTVDVMLQTSTQPAATLNIAISQTGLEKLGIQDNLNDTLFTAGQFADAPNLAELTDTWIPAFKGTSIHGAYIIASDSSDSLVQQNSSVQAVLGSSINVLYSIQGQVRPGDQQGHEHFGFLDGISQPIPEGFGTPLPGQAVVPPGTILMGRDGDLMTRPSWATDSSFLAFRQLKQMVPEFHSFANSHPASIPGMPAAQAAALTSARMIGRWPSGAPVDLSPMFDDPELGADPTRNNNFDYTHQGFNLSSDQVHCPFSAHIRKTVPRKDLNPVDVKHHIVRSGITFGPEVTELEQQSGETAILRGLLFLAVQSSFAQGFSFLQRAWIDNPIFVPGKSVSPGFDPLLGQNNGSARITTGIDPILPEGNTTLVNQFVISQGGEYLFLPSITAWQHIIS